MSLTNNMKSKLNNIKKAGYKTPEDYFQNLEDKIMDNIKLNEALQNIENEGFKAPEGYFDTLENIVLNKIKDEKKTKVISLLNKQTLIYISGVAAAVVIMFNIFYNNSEVSLETIDTDIVENYFIDEGIDTYEIAALFTEEELTTINNDIFDQTFNDDSLEDYLLENAIIEDIIDQ